MYFYVEINQICHYGKLIDLKGNFDLHLEHVKQQYGTSAVSWSEFCGYTPSTRKRLIVEVYINDAIVTDVNDRNAIRDNLIADLPNGATLKTAANIETYVEAVKGGSWSVSGEQLVED